MTRRDPELGRVRTTADALAAGMTHHQVARRVRRRRWHRLRPGAYCASETWDGADRNQRHVLLAHAALRTMPDGYVLSHVSAAAVHGLPLPVTEALVWMTSRPPSTTRYLGGMRLLVAAVDDADLDRRLSRTTSVERTVLDCLRHLPDPDAVAVADAAVRRWPDLDLNAVFDRQHRWPYVERARRLLPLVDGRRESPLESASAVRMHRCGVPAPELQTEFYDGDLFLGRCDFWWPDLGVVGEADGMAKYTSAQALTNEKRREDRLRAMGLAVARWSYSDLLGAGWDTWLKERLRSGRPQDVRARVVTTQPVRLRLAR